MVKVSIILFHFILFSSYAQKYLDTFKKSEGIWIAKDYFQAFEETNSALRSKNAFNFSYPVGIRINTKELKNGILNIGYARLHDHILHPEISDYILKNNDTIREQGSFKVSLKDKNSLGYFKTTEIHYFNDERVSFLKINGDENILTLYRPKSIDREEECIEFVRVKEGFEKNYQFPNPLYYYIRRNNLIGSYKLMDGKDNLLSPNFTITEKGIIKGFEQLENFKIHYSTDIYCGPTAKYDHIIFVKSMKYDTFIIEKNQNGNISLYNREFNMDNGGYDKCNKVYELIFKN